MQSITNINTNNVSVVNARWTNLVAIEFSVSISNSDASGNNVSKREYHSNVYCNTVGFASRLFELYAHCQPDEYRISNHFIEPTWYR